MGKNKTIGSRIIAFLVSALMVTTVVQVSPVTAMAEDVQSEYETGINYEEAESAEAAAEDEAATAGEEVTEDEAAAAEETVPADESTTTDEDITADDTLAEDETVAGKEGETGDETPSEEAKDDPTAVTAEVALVISQDGNTITPASAVFTDAEGKETKVENANAISLSAGDYTFVITDGKENYVSGSYTVAEGAETAQLTADIPGTDWVGNVEFGIASRWSDGEEVEKETVSARTIKIYVPDYAGTNLYPYFTAADGVDKNTVGCYYSDTRKSWESYSASFSGVCDKDSLENGQFTYQAMKDTSADTYGYLQYQNYYVNIVRTPSLSGLSVYKNDESLPISFENDTFEYNVKTVGDVVDVMPTALCEGATVKVNGKDAVSGEKTSVTLADCEISDGKYVINVAVTAPEASSTYVIYVEKQEAAEVTFTVTSGDVLTVYNSADSAVTPASMDGTTYVYELIPNDAYSYVTTKNDYYHAKASFTATDDLEITAASPKAEDWLSSMAAKSSTATAAIIYNFSPEFVSSVHDYTMYIGSTNSSAYLQAVPTDASLYSVTAYFKTYTGVDKKISPSATSWTNLVMLVTATGMPTEMRLEVKQKTDEDGVSYYQDYNVNVARTMELTSLSISKTDGSTLSLEQAADSDKGFNKSVLEYKTGVSAGTDGINLTFKVMSMNLKQDYGEKVTISTDSYKQEFTFNEEQKPVDEISCTVPLNTEVSDEYVTITVSHEDETSVAQSYRLHVVQLAAVETTITVSPENAIVFLKDAKTNEHMLPNDEGVYTLNDTAKYTVNVTCNGYKGISETFTAGEDKKSLSYTLEKAPETEYKDISGDDDWASFRGNDDNNGVTSAEAPISSEDTVLVWANKVGDSYGSKAAGCPILVGGYLYTYSGTDIIKIDKETGEIVARGAMSTNSSFAINSPTYAAGMLFVGLKNGTIQAFNAETLESLWIYQDDLKGQPNCQINYYNGYIYTGFWNSETKPANYVCISVTDEDPTSTTELKTATWTYTGKGFYWAGACIKDGMLLLTTDDGASGSDTGHGEILSLDPLTGKVKSDVTATGVGDLRSAVCYDEATDAYYFTSKGGDFYQFKVNEDGTINESSLRSIQLQNGSGKAAASTSTPVVYNGRAYIGVSGSGQFSASSGHNITVIDLESFTIAYTVTTAGYPQTSGLLTTAYEDTDGYVYVYFIENYTPGKIRVIRDKPGMTEMDHTYSSIETITSGGVTTTIETAYTLFTPSGSQAQYAICSPIIDGEGNIYFKNDSAQLMKLSTKVKSLNIDDASEVRTEYCVGETFDSTGLEVSAVYANGATKDISDHIGYSDEALTSDDTEVIISYDLDSYLTGDTSYWQLYGDSSETGAGTKWEMPYTSIGVTVYDEHVDEDMDRICDRCGAAIENSLVYADVELSENEMAYTGSALEPAVKVTYDDTELIKDTDYTVEYKDNVSVGTATVTITGIGTYSGQQEKTFVINKADQTDFASIDKTSIYLGETAEITLAGAYGSVKYSSSADAVATVKDGTITPVAPGTATITVTVSGDANHNAATLTFKVTVGKQAPTVASISNTSTSGLKITWGAVTGATGYRIFKSTDGVNFTKIAEVSADKLSYTDTDSLVTGTTYSYKMRTLYGTKYSAFSNIVSKLRVARPAISSISNTKGGLKLTWAKVDGASGYYVWRSINGGTYTKIKTITSGSTVNYTNTNSMTSGSKYSYKVQAYVTKADGTVQTSYKSAAKTSYRLARPVISAVSSVSSGAKVTWAKVDGATGYYVYRSVNGGSYSKVATITSGSTVKYTDTKATTSGTKYSYKIYAYKTVSGTTYKSYVSAVKSITK